MIDYWGMSLSNISLSAAATNVTFEVQSVPQCAVVRRS
jgi:hypothetical protein